jgi:hypothetical protein
MLMKKFLDDLTRSQLKLYKEQPDRMISDFNHEGSCIEPLQQRRNGVVDLVHGYKLLMAQSRHHPTFHDLRRRLNLGFLVSHQLSIELADHTHIVRARKASTFAVSAGHSVAHAHCRLWMPRLRPSS